MANIRMPIEIKSDNTIVPLQQLSNVYVDFIIDSINDIDIDRTLPDILTQATRMFQERVVHSTLNADVQVDPGTEVENNSPSPSNTHHMWIMPDELHKTPPHFKRNTSFKNRGKYSHRTTAKTRTT
jgi:hypothetical protein